MTVVLRSWYQLQRDKKARERLQREDAPGETCVRFSFRNVGNDFLFFSFYCGKFKIRCRIKIRIMTNFKNFESYLSSILK